jgi:Holliday junction resolvase-like predicted endonuclease
MKWFVDREYYVFDETNQGPIDFVAVNMEGDVKYIECKKLARRKDGSKIYRVLSDKQKRLASSGLNIDIAYVDVDTGEVSFNTTKENINV